MKATGAVRKFVGLVGLVCVGCAAESPMAPSAQPAQEFSLFGSVQDTAFRPIAGVAVGVLDGPAPGVSAVTDSTGRFALPGVFTGAITVRASKAEYIPVTKTYQTSHPGPQALYFALESIRPAASIAGGYTLTLRADDACTNLPEATRTRTYAATITPRATAATTYEVVLTNTGFGSSLHSGRFYAGVAGHSARFLMDPDDGFAIVERLDPLQSLAIYGVADGDIDGTRISGPLSGSFDFCSNLGLAPVDSFRCNAPPVTCQSSNHRLVLIRR
jgi:hypothetical protein